MRGRRRNRVLLVLILLVLQLAGCWDRKEIEEKATVLASGVDLCTQGEECEVILTRQFAIPGKIPQGSAEGGGGRRGETVYILASPGKNVLDTNARAQAELHRGITFGHIRVLVLSEEYARRGTEVYFDYIRRLSDARRLMWVLVSEGSAGDVIRARPQLERVPALYLSDMMDDAVKAGRMPRVYWGDLLVRLSNEGEDAIAPLVRMAGPDEPQLAGLAVFRGDRMVGKLSMDETSTYMQVQGIRRGAELVEIELPGGNHADIRVYGRGATYRISQTGGRITARIEVELETELIQLSPALSSSDPQVIQAIQSEAARELNRRATALVEKLQHQFGADILALGERVRARLPSAWRSIRDWRTAFADARIQVQIRVHVRRSGMGTE